MKIFEIDDQGDLFKDAKPAQFNVLINGEVWCEDGEPRIFNSYDAARTVANNVYAKTGKITQVAPHGLIPPKVNHRKRVGHRR